MGSGYFLYQPYKKEPTSSKLFSYFIYIPR